MGLATSENPQEDISNKNIVESVDMSPISAEGGISPDEAESFEGISSSSESAPDQNDSNLSFEIEEDPNLTARVHKIHPLENVIGSLETRVCTRSMHGIMYACFLSQVEPQNVSMALQDNSWVEAMQEELNQFQKLKVRELVDLPRGKYPIGAKWVFRNKKDDRGIIVRKKQG
jgi:hypothetical protein